MSSHHPSSLSLVHMRRVLAALVLVCGCGRQDAKRTSHTPLLAIEQALAWHGSVRLEENPSVINVSPRVTPDTRGAFLVTDGQEQQLRFYTSDGHLLGTAGRRGSGPGEFQNLTRAVRLRDGSILTADMGGALTRLDSEGAHVLSIARTGLLPIYELVVLDDSVVVIIGRKGGRMEGPLLHEWNLATSRISRSYDLAPQGPRGFSGAYAFTGFADAAARGDTIAVLFALEDTVRLFVRGGRPIGAIPVPFRGFRPLTTPLDPAAPPDRFQAWIESFSAATDLYWLQDGSFLVQYFDQKRSDHLFSLLHMSRDGNPVWEVSHTPKLLALTAQDSLVFVRPGADAPNEWSIATLAGPQ
ncbi:MAG TPA: hypothetical protein VFJ16_00710 [Longimicrobium sp.]|nr:hypothetical protein [Longimicrobium sp.]